MKVVGPVFIGDSIHVDITVIEKRNTKKPDRGIVAFSHQVVNQDGSSVMTYEVRRMIRCRQ